VRKAIVDKNVIIPTGVHIGVDSERDGKRFTLSGRGIVVIGKGQAIWPDD
jgi:glucose-1-phosphate adenylyltransferase